MQVRRFVKRGLLFVAPLAIWAIIVGVVDPFDYFGVIHLPSEKVKIENAGSINTLLFNMVKELHDPAENLIIGDSRVENLSIDQIQEISGQRFHRLSANALKLNEALDLFWFANRREPVKRVVFGINFNQYNDYAYADRVRSVEALTRNPLLYIFDRNVAQATYYVVKASLTGRNVISSIPPMSKDEFWHYIVTVRAREHYGRYRHPDELYQRMKDLSSFCKAKGIEVTFIIVPHHADFQRQVADFGLVSEYLRFKREMINLGVKVVDYDYPSELTRDKSNFADPIHYNTDVGRMIVNEVFGGRLIHGRLMTSDWGEKLPQFAF
jgi:hypothetical protein